MSKRQITAEEVLEAIRSDMIDSEIMQKYQVTAKELRDVYRALCESKSVDIAEMYCRPVYWDNNVDLEPRREFPRLLLAFILPVHDRDNLDARGIVADVTEKGMKLEGMKSNVGEKRRLTVNPTRFGDMDPIDFEAECRWSKTEGPDQRPVAGFQITEISDGALHELRRFIRFVTTGRTGKPKEAAPQASEEVTAAHFETDNATESLDAKEPRQLQEPDERQESDTTDTPEKPEKSEEPGMPAAAPTKRAAAFNVSLAVNCPESFKNKIIASITRELEALPDACITNETKSQFHIAIFAIEGEARLFCSVAITRTIWTDVEFCMRRALLDMWERISEKPKEGLLYRGAVINEVLRRVGTDNSLKGIQDHWPMVVTSDALDKACEKIVNYLDSKFLEPKRRKRKH
jgi:hypothetical protein